MAAARGGTAPWILAGAFVAAFLPPMPAPVAAQEAEETDCAECHADPDLFDDEPDASGSSLYVNLELFSESVHGDFDCVDCHEGYEEVLPHPEDTSTTWCGDCHDDALEAFEASIHAEADTLVTCARCHGVHDVFPSTDRRARTRPLDEVALCASCHADPAVIATYFPDPKGVARTAVARYHQTVHGIALERAGLIVSATCSDCHGHHRILPHGDPESTVNRNRVADTCGACHVGVVEAYEESAHGVAAAEGRTTQTGQGAPVCTDCHSAHGIAEVTEGWKRNVVEECGTCHVRLYDTYFKNYHGKVTELGAELTAKCSDCHTPHANFPASDPRSTVNPANLVQTCAKCHPQSSERFVQYYAHGDVKDRARFPQVYWTYLVMTTLLASVFGVFGTHSLLWLIRSLRDRIARRLARKPNGESNPEGKE